MEIIGYIWCIKSDWGRERERKREAVRAEGRKEEEREPACGGS